MVLQERVDTCTNTGGHYKLCITINFATAMKMKSNDPTEVQTRIKQTEVQVFLAVVLYINHQEPKLHKPHSYR